MLWDHDVLVRRGCRGPAADRVPRSPRRRAGRGPGRPVAGVWLLGRHDPDAVPRLAGLLDDPSATVLRRGDRRPRLVRPASRGRPPGPARRRVRSGGRRPPGGPRAAGEVGPADPRAVAALLARARRRPLDSARGRGGAGAADPAGPAIVAALAGVLGDAERFVRRTAARSLGRIGPRDDAALARLAAACSDPEDDVRRHARANLFRLLPEGDDEAGVGVVVSTLAEALSSHDWDAALGQGRAGRPRRDPPRSIPGSDGPYRHPACVDRPLPRPRPEAARGGWPRPSAMPGLM